MASRFEDYESDNSSSDGSGYSDENEEGCEPYQGVQGYQFEPKRREKPSTDSSPGQATAGAAVDRTPSRAGRLEWLLYFRSLYHP